jgi:5-(carboxyamino)imidazole ribonucleotide synthase
MLALAGLPLGIEFIFLDPADSPCAAALGTHIRADYADPSAVERMTRGTSVVTTEFENVPAEAMRLAADRVATFPAVGVLATAQDRVLEKALFQGLGIPTAAYAAIDSREALEAFARRGRCIVKTRRMGYDGKGQCRVRDSGDIAAAWTRLGAAPLIAEEWLEFDREVSIVAVRGRDGGAAFYPVAENEHRNGILALSHSRPGDPIQLQAEDHARRIMTELDYVGVIAIEFFQRGNALLANEIAPRVHNTGHWTIEGAVTSQFENHLRAILGLPLGRTAARGHSAMLNCLGRMPDHAAVLGIPGAHLHDYGKPPMPGRKVGHITCTGDSEEEVAAAMSRLSALLKPESPPNGLPHDPGL